MQASRTARTNARSGPLDKALAAAASVLESDPAGALNQADAILQQAPQLPAAELLAGQALRRLGRPAIALLRLSALHKAHPRVPAVAWELAQAASETGQPEQAIAALEGLTRQLPAIAGGWFMLGRELRKLGRTEQAWRAELAGINASTADPELLGAAAAMNDGRLDDSAAMLATRLARAPDDAPALRMAGEIRWRRGDIEGAISHLERALATVPGFDLAREFLIRLLVQSNRLPEALRHAETLEQSPIESPGHDLIKASILVRLGEQDSARRLYEKLLDGRADQPQVWQNLGHVLKTLGRQSEAIKAYRQAVTRQPTMGEAWWSLANLKTVQLGSMDIAAMQQALTTLDPASPGHDEDRFHMHFALGKAFEDARDHATAFGHYDRGNRLRRAMVRHDSQAFSAEVAETARTFTAAFIAGRGDGGCQAPDPIFIIGLPRSGSTLVEQILSSHSQVEGTMELADMMMITSRLQARVDSGEFAGFAAMIASLTPADRLRLGEEYIERTRIQRRSDRPFFIDKMPNNWQHIGLIQLILPRARIIDARRHPMSCCFSGWKQHFARGQTFSYDLGDIAAYYRDYVGLMAAYDAAAPGAVHRVIYEALVSDTEHEVRRLLTALDLPFEPACLEFYKNDRAVRTASSEQVRQPIFTDGIDQWRNFEPWLGPLVAALGSAATAYPEVPADLLPPI